MSQHHSAFAWLLLISRRFSEDHLGVFAAQAAFFVTLSALPLLMVSISLIRFTLPLSFDDLEAGLLELTPANLHSLVTWLLQDAYQKSSATILSLSTVTALWSASKCVYALRQGLNHILHIKMRRGYLYNRISSVFYTLGLLLVLLFSLVILIFGNRLQQLLIRFLPVLAPLTGRLISLRGIPAILILMVFFLCIYALLPDERASFQSQLPGAMLSTAGWLFLSFGFSFYVDHFSGYSMYGSLTALILSMLWIYFCMYLVFIGSELNLWLAEET